MSGAKKRPTRFAWYILKDCTGNISHSVIAGLVHHFVRIQQISSSTRQPGSGVMIFLRRSEVR